MLETTAAEKDEEASYSEDEEDADDGDGGDGGGVQCGVLRWVGVGGGISGGGGELDIAGGAV